MELPSLASTAISILFSDICQGRIWTIVVRGELALVVAKGGVDVGAASAFILPMVGAMTIITTFISPYAIKFGWRPAENSRPPQSNKDTETNNP